jgi:hypothetical protein
MLVGFFPSVCGAVWLDDLSKSYHPNSLVDGGKIEERHILREFSLDALSDGTRGSCLTWCV